MVFSSLIFIFFFLPPLLLLYFLTPKKYNNVRNIILILFSLFFYAWGEPIFVLAMIVSTIIDYTAGWFIGESLLQNNKKRAKKILLLSLVSNLSLLGFFKYSDFIIITINGLLGLNIPLLNLPLPIGISFYTFQTMSYSIDVYRGVVKRQKSFLKLLLYTTLFPQLVAGPIVRYQTVENQIEHRTITFDKFSRGCIRFIIGLAKKIIIANRMAAIADYVFGLPASEIAVLTSWLGIIAYTFQIYFDFSGYSDMAIGLGRMFGFEFEENFNYPYISNSISEFWRRWHMSLGVWFRDYVYFPLGGSRVDTKFQLYRNLFIVWFLTGLWHGASWNFAVWGIYYFLLLAIEKTFIKKKPKEYSPFKNLIVMIFVIIGWVFFRVEDLSEAIIYIRNMFMLQGTPLTDYNTSFYFVGRLREFIIAFICSLPIVPLLKAVYRRIKNKYLKLAADAAQMVFILAVFAISVINLVNESYNPFIYFRF